MLFTVVMSIAYGLLAFGASLGAFAVFGWLYMFVQALRKGW